MKLYDQVINSFSKEDKENAMNCSKWHDPIWKDKLPKNIKYEIMEQVGGEDEGSYYHNVIKFYTEHTYTYIMFHGSYASYDGTHYHDCCEVFPEEIVYTKYLNKEQLDKFNENKLKPSELY